VDDASKFQGVSTYVGNVLARHGIERDLSRAVRVLQDIFHAQDRVVRQLRRRHPDYAQAREDLKAIFAKLRSSNPSHFSLNPAEEENAKGEFKEALQAYKNQYSHDNAALSSHDLVQACHDILHGGEGAHSVLFNAMVRDQDPDDEDSDVGSDSEAKSERRQGWCALTIKGQKSIDFLCESQTLDAIFHKLTVEQEHPDVAQRGTTPIEAWHRALRARINSFTTSQKLSNYQSFVEIFQLQYNSRERIQQSKRTKTTMHYHLPVQGPHPGIFSISRITDQQRQEADDHAWMCLTQRGFQTQQVFYRWTDEERIALLHELHGIHQQVVHTANPFHFIAHHLMGLKKSSGAVRSALRKIAAGNEEWQKAIRQFNQLPQASV
jgi:hypothetical protein